MSYTNTFVSRQCTHLHTNNCYLPTHQVSTNVLHFNGFQMIQSKNHTNNNYILLVNKYL